MSENRIRIVVDPSGAESGARRVNRSFESMQGAAGGMGRSFSSLEAGLSSLKVGFLAVAAGAVAVGTAFYKALQEAENFARGTRQLDATLRATGNKIGLMRGELVAFAEELEGKLAIPAEDILRTQAALATFDGIAGPIFKRTISAAADLSAVFGGDLQSNSEKLGTVLQNLADGNVEGLSRGFRFLGTETTKMIEQLAQTGETAKAQDVLLSELEKRIGGQGEAAAGGLTGATFRLTDAWGDLLRAFGEGRSGEIAIGWIDRLAQKLSDMRPALQNAIVGFDALLNGRNPDEAVRDAMLGVTDDPGSGKVKGGRGGGGAGKGFAGGFREPSASVSLATGGGASRAFSDAQTSLRRAEQVRETALERENELLRRQGEKVAEIADMTERLNGSFAEDFDRALADQSRRFNPQSSIFDAGGPEELQGIADRVLNEAGYGAGREVARGFRDEGALAAEALGQIIGGKAGQSLQQVAGLFQGLASGDFTGIGGPLGGSLTLLSQRTGKQGAGALSEGIREAFRQPVKSFRETGELLQGAFKSGGGLEKVLGKAAGGAAAGTIVAGLGNALGIKMNQTGAQIGGAIGSFIPIPGGEIIGSIAGGLIGNIGPTPRAYSNLSVDADGNVVVSSGGARGSKRTANIAAAGQAAGSVSDALSSILGAIGGTLRAGSTIGTIGPVGDQFGYATTGAVGGSNKSLIKFSTAEEAAEALIKSVFQRGLVQGIDSFTQKVLTSSKSLESAVDLAARYRTALDLIEQRDDPVGSAAREAARQFDDLIREMKSFGATAEEVSKIEGLRTDALKAALDDQLSSLRSFQAALSGEGSGVTSASRLSAALADYDKQRALIGQEGFDQASFTSLGQQVFALARDIYGTSTIQFQEIRKRLMADTSNAISSTESAFNAAAQANAPVVSAIEDQTQVAIQSYQLQIAGNQILAEIRELLARGGTANDSGGVNGGLAAAVR